MLVDAPEMDATLNRGRSQICISSMDVCSVNNDTWVKGYNISNTLLEELKSTHLYKKLIHSLKLERLVFVFNAHDETSLLSENEIKKLIEETRVADIEFFVASKDSLSGNLGANKTDELAKKFLGKCTVVQVTNAENPFDKVMSCIKQSLLSEEEAISRALKCLQDLLNAEESDDEFFLSMISPVLGSIQKVVGSQQVKNSKELLDLLRKLNFFVRDYDFFKRAVVNNSEDEIEKTSSELLKSCQSLLSFSLQLTGNASREKKIGGIAMMLAGISLIVGSILLACGTFGTFAPVALASTIVGAQLIAGGVGVFLGLSLGVGGGALLFKSKQHGLSKQINDLAQCGKKEAEIKLEEAKKKSKP